MSDRGEVRAILGKARLERLKRKAERLEISEQELLRRMIDAHLPLEEQGIDTSSQQIIHQIATGGTIGGALAVASASSPLLASAASPSLTQQSLTPVDTPPVQESGQGDVDTADNEPDCECSWCVPGQAAEESYFAAKYGAERMSEPTQAEIDAECEELADLRQQGALYGPVTSSPKKQRKSRQPKAEGVVVNPDFEAFYSAWPAGPRKSRKPALRAFLAARSAGDLPALPELLRAVDWWKRQPDWTKEGGAYVPAIEVWIHKGRWEPALAEAAQPQPTLFPVCPEDPGAKALAKAPLMHYLATLPRGDPIAEEIYASKIDDWSMAQIEEAKRKYLPGG